MSRSQLLSAIHLVRNLRNMTAGPDVQYRAQLLTPLAFERGVIVPEVGIDYVIPWRQDESGHSSPPEPNLAVFEVEVSADQLTLIEADPKYSILWAESPDQPEPHGLVKDIPGRDHVRSFGAKSRLVRFLLIHGVELALANDLADVGEGRRPAKEQAQAILNWNRSLS